MKDIAGIFAGGAAGNLLYAHTLGTPGDHHWLRSFLFSAMAASVLVLVRAYRKSKLRVRSH